MSFKESVRTYAIPVAVGGVGSIAAWKAIVGLRDAETKMATNAVIAARQRGDNEYTAKEGPVTRFTNLGNGGVIVGTAIVLPAVAVTVFGGWKRGIAALVAGGATAVAYFLYGFSQIKSW